MSRAKNPILEGKLAIARKVVSQLRPVLQRNLRAAGVTGSVARGTAQKYSDIDLLIIVRKDPGNLRAFGIREAHGHNQFLFLDDTYCSLGFETWNSAVSQLTRPSYDLPELLGGFTKVRPLYDPERLLPRLQAKALKIPSRIFRESAELALLHSYEDFCRVKNAYLSGDRVVMRDNSLYVTHSAALVVASLNHSHFRSDREIFKAHKGFSSMPKRFDEIEKLRYAGLEGRRQFRMLLRFYLNLIGFAEEHGIRFPVEKKKLMEV